jgi:hypothetical protein
MVSESRNSLMVLSFLSPATTAKYQCLSMPDIQDALDIVGIYGFEESEGEALEALLETLIYR